MSDRYVTTQACSTGSSGSSPSARIQIRWYGGSERRRSANVQSQLRGVEGHLDLELRGHVTPE